jgi:hypothetical protein
MSDNGNGRTFQPRIREDGAVQAGGLTLFTVAPGSLELRFPDRYRARCQARGTDDVQVSLLELIEEILLYYESRVDSCP